MCNESILSAYKQSCIDYYNHMHDIYFDKYHKDLEYKIYDKEFLLHFVNQLPVKSKILDIGCGSAAQQARFFRDMGHQITAIDVSEKCIETAKQKFTGIQFQQMDMLDMHFESHTFDAINAFYSFIHIPKEHSHTLFSLCNRILRPNGLMAIAVYADDFYGYYDKNEIPVFYRSYSQTELTTLLVGHGFEIIHMDERQAIYDFEFQCERIYVVAKKQ